MNKKYLVGLSVLLLTLAWVIIRVGGWGSIESEDSENNSTKARDGHTVSEEQEVRSTSRTVPNNKKFERDTESRALSRAQGYLKPEEIDLTIHVKIRKDQYTERVEVDDKLYEQIFSQIENRDQQMDDEKNSKVEAIRSRLETIIDSIATGGEEKRAYFADNLERLFGENEEAYAKLDEIIIEAVKYDTSNVRKKIISELVLEIPLPRNEVSVNSVQEAFNEIERKSSFWVVLPRFYETETHYIFFTWDSSRRGYSIRKEDSLVRAWLIPQNE